MEIFLHNMNVKLEIPIFGKGKNVLFFLTMNAYRGRSRGIGTLILILGTRWW